MESGHNMSYLYKLYIIVDDDSDNLSNQSIIDEAVEKEVEKHSNMFYIGSKICELTNNYGKCCQCGEWVSDHDLTGYIDGCSDGCIIDDKWWCDLCLPNDHPKSF